MFITFEGPEGSGKTTQIPQIEQFLKDSGYPVFCTREPGGTSIGDQIRQVLLANQNTEMHPRSEILLFQASRAQLVEQEIKPRLARGEIVLCDRYANSTIAYQGFGHRVDIVQLHNIVNFATGGLNPDLTLLFDLDVEVGLARRQEDGGVNRLDAFELAFHQRVRAGYHELAAAQPDRWVIVDANQPPELVRAAVCEIIRGRLGGIG